MTISAWNSLASWNDEAVQDDDGRVAFRFGLGVTLYFRDAFKEEKRQAVLECFNEYDARFGDQLRWYFAGQGPFHRVAKLRSRDLTPYLMSPKWEDAEARDHAWAIYWHGGEHSEDASPTMIEIYGSPRLYSELDDSLSFLHASVPIAWCANNVETLIGLVKRWCDLLQPHHGYGGLALLTSPDRALTQYYAPQIAGFAARYPGIEIDRPMSHKMHTQDGIKGGSWLTVLSARFMDQLGGAAAMAERLAEDFRLEPYSGGLLVIAGTAPEVGDTNQNLDTPRYRRLAKVLGPIRIREHPPLYPKGRFSREGEYESWLGRFDD